MPEAKRVCVIGAGASGLVAVKYMVDAGLTVVAFESSPHLGGLWKYKSPMEGGGPMYKHLTTNVPKDYMAYSDFAFPVAAPKFPSHTVVYDYLCDYAAHFGLGKYVHLNRKLVSARKGADGGWKVVTHRTDANTTETQTEHRFDYLVVASGHYGVPVMPSIVGVEDFPGEVVHSCAFDNADAFAGKRVLIIGGSVSGGDQARMLAAKGVDVIVLVKPDTRNRTVEKTIMSLTERGVKLRLGTLTRLTPKKTAVIEVVSESVMESSCEEHTVDVVICATGYRYSYPFFGDHAPFEDLTPGGRRVAHLYKRVFFTPDPSIVFLGTPNSVFPPNSVFEYQARWAAKVFSDRKTLPSKAIMDIEVTEREVLPNRTHAAANPSATTPNSYAPVSFCRRVYRAGVGITCSAAH
jgi:thioredoxin reductase